MNRFHRTELLLGPEAMQLVRNARVAVFGLGAVGSYAIEGLARAGVGHLRVVDFDVVRESNINRQLFALGSTIGQPKTELARLRIHDINPDCQVDVRHLFIDGQTAPQAVAAPLDVAIDAIDSVGPKVTLLAAAVEAGLKVISCMGAATRTDPFAIRAGDLSETAACPLARQVRRRLKRRGISTGIRCIYSREPARTIPALPLDPDEHFLRGRPRAPLPSLSYLTGIFGLVAAHEALAFLLGWKAPVIPEAS